MVLCSVDSDYNGKKKVVDFWRNFFSQVPKVPLRQYNVIYSQQRNVFAVAF